MAEYDSLVKVLLIGDSGTGKSALILRYADNTFSESTLATIGVDFKIKTLVVDGYTIKLQIWDTAGQERFRTITSSYYRGAHAIILVYDASDSNSLNSASRLWLVETDRYACENVRKILVANKIDLQNTQELVEQGRAVAKELDMPHHEVSAKTGQGVEELFMELARNHIKSHGIQKRASGGVRVRDQKASKKKACMI